MKKKISTVILLLAFFAGVSLLLYPTVSDYWNSYHASRAVAVYSEDVQKLDRGQYARLLEEARAYNTELVNRENVFSLSDTLRDQYDTMLDITGTGVMGYIEIPSIKISLPIYHGTEESVLQVAIGHIEWSSLPVGGESTHCVLSGHRGLPSARLFTNLDQLTEGDRFVIRTLDEVMTYEVDQILIVEPDDISALAIEDGKDLCTLVTCTPYGVNSHRLLVRGTRVENASTATAVRVTSDAVQVEPLIVAPLVAFPMVLILLLLLFAGNRDRRHNGGKKRESND